MLKLQILLLNCCLGNYTGSHHFSESFFHIFVSQAVDQGIQHGNHYSVEYRSHFINIQTFAKTVLAINKKDCSMDDSDGCEVGGTGRKCSVSSLCRAHPQDGDKNKQVGGQDDHNGKSLIEIDHNEHQHLIDSDIRASKT
jgi:hypothetical protein